MKKEYTKPTTIEVKFEAQGMIAASLQMSNTEIDTSVSGNQLIWSDAAIMPCASNFTSTVVGFVYAFFINSNMFYCCYSYSSFGLVGF